MRQGLHGMAFRGNADFLLSVKFAKNEQKGPPTSYLKRVTMVCDICSMSLLQNLLENIPGSELV